MLVIDGKEFTQSKELDQIGLALNRLLGKKGGLSMQEDYWDVATFFEIAILVADYKRANQAAEKMFTLKPPPWYLKSTINNVSLIQRFRTRQNNEKMGTHEIIFQFWLDYFSDAIAENVEDTDQIRFPILIRESNNVYHPSYATFSLHVDPSSERSIHIDGEDYCPKCLSKSTSNECRQVHSWTFTASMIKTVTTYKRDDRCLFLYVHSDDFQLYFASDAWRQKFNNYVHQITEGFEDTGFIADLETGVQSTTIEFEYDIDENGDKAVLGKGTYGIVYAARDLNTQISIAVKEVPEKNIGDVHPLHEEIKLHSQLKHKNIVQYRGSLSQDGFFKIIMEQVPGGSLSNLLRGHTGTPGKWGPLKGNEGTIAYYSKQILEGLKYLHDQKIVHRDIKGDNVLVNTYSGVLKISDFGTSKRLAEFRYADTFAGTLQYMAPEVIDKGQRGYGAPADIWSLGCTVVEMATGNPPFIELGNPQAAMFKVGFYKIHPEIPKELSESAQKFILRCFEPDPKERASAAQLLDDPFIIDAKKRSILRLRTQESRNAFGRSISTVNEESYSPTHMEANNHGSKNPVLESVTKSPLSNVNGTLRLRRQSETSLASGSAMSPDIVDGKDDGFYRLKQDSERRVMLVKLLEAERSRICDHWFETFLNDIPSGKETSLSKDHLFTLFDGMRDFLPDRNDVPIKEAITLLEEEFQYDGAKVNHVQQALLRFQDAVNPVLRSKHIQPHWMFALDTLVRSAVHACIAIVSPDIDIEPHPQPFKSSPKKSSTVGTGTSGSSQDKDNSVSSTLDEPSNYTSYDQLQRLKLENTRLLSQLIKDCLGEIEILKDALTSLKTKQIQIEQQMVLPGSPPDAACVCERRSVGEDNASILRRGDPALVTWLRNQHCDNETILKVNFEFNK